MKFADFEGFQKIMQMISHDKIIFHMLFGGFLWEKLFTWQDQVISWQFFKCIKVSDDGSIMFKNRFVVDQNTVSLIGSKRVSSLLAQNDGPVWVKYELRMSIPFNLYRIS